MCATAKVPYDTIRPEFDYFGNQTQAVDIFSDNCPYNIKYSNGDCGMEKNYKINNLYAEQYGSTSRCFTGDFVKESFKNQYTKDAFYHTTCLHRQATKSTQLDWWHFIFSVWQKKAQ